jgi:hypothetical protein
MWFIIEIPADVVFYNLTKFPVSIPDNFLPYSLIFFIPKSALVILKG